MVSATLRKNPGPPMLKQSHDLCLLENHTAWKVSKYGPEKTLYLDTFNSVPRVVGNMHFFVSCQIDVVNMKPVFPLRWKNQKTTLGEGYIHSDDLRTSRSLEKTHLECWGSL